jgi:hypothetical protein
MIKVTLVSICCVLALVMGPAVAQSQQPTTAPTTIPNDNASGTAAILLIYILLWVILPSGAIMREYQQGKRLEAEKRKLIEAEGEGGISNTSRLQSSRGGTGRFDDEEDYETSQSRAKEVVKDLLSISLARIFEGVFSREVSAAKKFEYELEHQHPYVSLFYSRKVGAKRWVHCFKLLTSLSVAACLLALFLDLHFPSNDGTSCYSSTNEADCITGNHGYFDLEKSQCAWSSAVSLCTFDDSEKPYGQKGFVIILMLVLLSMAGVNLVLDIIFDVIISAPAMSDTKDVGEDLTRDDLRLQFHKKVQAQLARLNKSIIEHRETLLDKNKMAELEEFDAQWGVHLAKDGSEELVWMDKIALDLYDVVKSSHDIRVKLQSKGEIQCGMHLLYLFALDLMGRTTPAGRIFANKTEDTVKMSRSRVSSGVKVFTVLVLMGCNITVAYYSRFYTQGKLQPWVNFYVVLFLTYFGVDCLVIEGAKVFWVDFMLPLLISPNAQHAESIIMHTLNHICEQATDIAREEEHRRASQQQEMAFAAAMGETTSSLTGEDTDDNNNKPPSSLTPQAHVPVFSASDHMFVSTRVAKHFPGLFESAIVLSYNEPLPFSTALYWGKHITRPRLTHRSVVPISEVGWDQIKKEDLEDEANQHSEGGVGMKDKDPVDALENAFERAHVHSLQNLRMQGRSSDSSLRTIYRNIAWFLLECSSVAPVEVQKFVTHIVHPCFIYAMVNLVYLIQNHISTGIYIVAVLMILVFILLMLYFSHERALKDAEVDHKHGLHHKDLEEEDDDEYFHHDVEGGGEVRGATAVRKSSDLLTYTLRREADHATPKLLSTAVKEYSKRGEMGFNVRSAVDPGSQRSSRGGGQSSVSFSAASPTPLEQQLQSKEDDEKKAAASQLRAKQDMQRALEMADVAKEEERDKQRDLMKRIMKTGGKGSSSMGMDQEDTYVSDRRAERKIENRMGRIDEGKQPFNDAYSSKAIKSPSVLSSTPPNGSLKGLITAHKIAPSPARDEDLQRTPIVYPRK